MLGRRIISVTLAFVAITATRGYAEHERFIVGEMRNVDPSAEIITSTSGACVPSHDRERLDCYFTSFGLWKVSNDEKAKKDLDEMVDVMNKEPSKMVDESRKLCSDKKILTPDPLQLKYNMSAKEFNTAIRAFCERPSRALAINLYKTMIESEAKKCRCVVSDWRSTLVRQVDRWVHSSGPGGLCGVINVFTLRPHDLKKMKEPVGPVLWRLEQQDVVTRADDDLCKRLKVTSGSMTLSWDAPVKSMDCRELDFSSALEGISEPRKK